MGDPQWPDNVDSITLDGVKAIDKFTATAAAKTMVTTVRVAVSDGRLTLDSTGGTNTKVELHGRGPGRRDAAPDHHHHDRSPGHDHHDHDAPPATTTTTTAPPDHDQPTTTPPVSAGAKGDVKTAERRVVTDPKVLWVGTFDEGAFTSTWGLTDTTAAANASVTSAPAGGHGKAIRIANAGGGTNGDRWGYDGRFGFKEMGIGSQDEAYLRYYVWFPADYEFEGTQGKMPALQGVAPGNPSWLGNSSMTCTSGPYKGKDCHDDRQFGARTMFKKGGMITYLNVVSAGGVDRDTNRTASGDNYCFGFRYQTRAVSQLQVQDRMELRRAARQAQHARPGGRGLRGLDQRSSAASAGPTSSTGRAPTATSRSASGTSSTSGAARPRTTPSAPRRCSTTTS